MSDPILKSSSLRRLLLLALCAWSVAVAAVTVWTIYEEHQQTNSLALLQGRSFFQEILVTRYWNAFHGGVYVPVDDTTQPNPYLDDPKRDVVTLDGTRLTKINPAYMTRQIAEMAAPHGRIQFHLTSRNPIRPGNRPDAWEAQALEHFERGAKEFSGWTHDGRENDYRYMAPLFVEKPCLTCHARQGYALGDLRGGISVTIPAGPLLEERGEQIGLITMTFGLIWLMGVIGTVMAYRRLSRDERENAALIGELKQSLEEIKVLHGLLPICASCKKIRNDQGYWQQIETYIDQHTEAKFSHGICPECMKKLYPEYSPDED